MFGKKQQYVVVSHLTFKRFDFGLGKEVDDLVPIGIPEYLEPDYMCMMANAESVWKEIEAVRRHYGPDYRSYPHSPVYFVPHEPKRLAVEQK